MHILRELLQKMQQLKVMTKSSHKKPKFTRECECGGEMLWGKWVDSNAILWSKKWKPFWAYVCEKCFKVKKERK
jgi:hypothetical protein